MSKRPIVIRFSKTKVKSGSAELTWHNGAETEIYFYARSLQRAAKKLVENHELQQNPGTDWDACPVILLYRQVLELRLKTLVGEGSNFLKSRTDPISLYRTRSLQWLAQIVRQIIKTVGWEKEFTCEGVSSLSAFTALVNEVESLDPVTRFVQSSAGPSASQQCQAFDVVAFGRRMDDLLDLLDVTADALAATWDQLSQRSSDEEAFLSAQDSKPTIH